MTFSFKTSATQRVVGGAVVMVGLMGSSANALDLVRQSGALNLGGTSFFDAYGRQDEGFTFLQYGLVADKYSDDENTGKSDKTSLPGFRLQTNALLEQLAYTSPWGVWGGHFAFSAAIPFTNFNYSDQPNAAVHLHPNSFGIGDMTWGPQFQSKIYKNDQGRNIFAWRTQLQIITPTGSFDNNKDFNQSSGFTVINPYVTFTVQPTAETEFSMRSHYVYNLKADKFSNPVSPSIYSFVYPIPNYAPLSNGQAGQAMFFDFAGSYKVADHLFLGFNGYYLHQFQDDRIDGVEVAQSRQELFYIGPGFRYEFSPKEAINVNLYLPVIVQNSTEGVALNFQFVHKFDTLADK